MYPTCEPVNHLKSYLINSKFCFVVQASALPFQKKQTNRILTKKVHKGVTDFKSFVGVKGKLLKRQSDINIRVYAVRGHLSVYTLNTAFEFVGLFCSCNLNATRCSRLSACPQENTSSDTNRDFCLFRSVLPLTSLHSRLISSITFVSHQKWRPCNHGYCRHDKGESGLHYYHPLHKRYQSFPHFEYQTLESMPCKMTV